MSVVKMRPWFISVLKFFSLPFLIGIALYGYVGGFQTVVLVSDREGDSAPASDPSVIILSTPAYIRRSGTFRIPLERADELHRAAEKLNPDWPESEDYCWLMDGDWYVYSSPCWKEGVGLRGVYINAFTGEVKFVSNYQGVVRFDLNWKLYSYRKGPYESYRIGPYTMDSK